MPFINVKLVKGQVSAAQREQIIAGLTDLAVEVMGRERDLTVIVLDEMEPYQWAIGGKLLTQFSASRIVSFVNIKISRGTSNPEEMVTMMKAVKDLMGRILGNGGETNYFVIDELNPDAWGFDGIPMTVRNNHPR